MWNLKDRNKVIGVQDKVLFHFYFPRSIPSRDISKPCTKSNQKSRSNNLGNHPFPYQNFITSTIAVLFALKIVHTL